MEGKVGTVAEVAEDLREAGKRYGQFLRVPALSAGVYLLAEGSLDPQEPHQEDEIYYVVEGIARFTAGEEDQDVGPGDVLYVPAGVVHRFHTIEKELVLLVVFGPAESTPAGPASATVRPAAAGVGKPRKPDPKAR